MLYIAAVQSRIDFTYKFYYHALSKQQQSHSDLDFVAHFKLLKLLNIAGRVCKCVLMPK